MLKFKEELFLAHNLIAVKETVTKFTQLSSELDSKLVEKVDKVLDVVVEKANLKDRVVPPEFVD